MDQLWSSKTKSARTTTARASARAVAKGSKKLTVLDAIDIELLEVLYDREVSPEILSSGHAVAVREASTSQLTKALELAPGEISVRKAGLT